MSAPCFVVFTAVEILAIDIRNNTNINGVDIGNYTHKLVQLAGDMTLFVKHHFLRTNYNTTTKS